MTKKIIINNRCQVLTSRGVCVGPVHVPFKEHTAAIFQMVCDEKADIREVLKDGSTLKLDVFNYDKDNEKPVPVVEYKLPSNPAIVKDEVEVVEEVVVEAPVEEVQEIQEETEELSEVTEGSVEEQEPRVQQNPNQNYNKKKGKNKHKGNNPAFTPVEEA